MQTDELIKEFKSLHGENVKRFDEQKAATDELSVRLFEVEQKMVRRKGSGGDGSDSGASLGSSIMAHDGFKAWTVNGRANAARFTLEGKTVSTIVSGATSGGAMIAPDFRPEVVALPQRRMTVRGLLAPGETTQKSVSMPRQTARQNNAAPVAELAAKPQSDFTMEVVEWPVRTIAHFVQTSRQVMDDAPALRSFIDAELQYGLQLAEENQLLTGDGTGENLLGLIPQATAYSPAFTVTDETDIDRVLMALLQAELSLFPASGVVLHPTDWTKMRMTKDAQGRYILGNPASPTPPVLWGVPLVVTPTITAGSFLVGAFFAAAQIFDRLGIEILLSTEHGTNFTTNQVTIRGEERLAMAVKRPAALITGSLPD